MRHVAAGIARIGSTAALHRLGAAYRCCSPAPLAHAARWFSVSAAPARPGLGRRDVGVRDGSGRRALASAPSIVTPAAITHARPHNASYLHTSPTMTVAPKQEYIVSVDVGTTSTRAIAFDATAAVLATHQIEYDQLYPQPGWHEQRPDDLINTVHTCLNGVAEALAAKGIGLDQVPGIGITNQRETTCVWSRSTGLPLYNAIAWPDTRNTGTVHELASRSPLGTEALKAKTGLPLSTYFSGTKFKWLLDNVPDVKRAHDTDDLLFGTVETWVLWNLTGGVDGGLHLTDVTNASRTMLMDLRTTAWDPECLEFFGVRKSALPKIVSNAEIYGNITSGAFTGKPVAGMIGDQQAALVGNKCVEKGSAKNTYGTGAFMLFNTGDRPVPSTHGLLTTPAFRVAGQTAYALEGSIAVAGSSIKWLRDQMEMISAASEIDPLANKVTDTGGVYFVPAFSGLFAPYWDDSAAGTLVGMSAYTNRAHIARATLEATCFQTRAILQAMAKDSGHELSALRVDGGMTNSDLCMQLQADILGIDVERPVMRESTALGSAICAGVALKRFGWDLARPETLREVNIAGRHTFKPQNDAEDRAKRWRGWERAVERAMHWKE